jgi:DNA-binding response OmpR family regulator
MVRYVLIVEDDDNVAPLEIALASLGDFCVNVFSDARAALCFLSENRQTVAAIVTDLNLPYLDGFEFITAVRSDKDWERLPIVVISGNGHPDVPGRVLQAGADAFFAKPYSPVEIRQTLARFLHVS